MPTTFKIHKKAQLTGHKASIFALARDQQDYSFLSGGGDGWIVRWDLNTPELGKLIATVEAQIFHLHYIPTLETIVVGNMNGGLHWIDVNTPSNNINIAHHKKGVFGILSVEDKLYTIGGGGLLTSWDALQKRSVESLQLSNQSLRSIDYSNIRNEIAIGSSDHSIYLIDATSFKVKYHLEQAHENSVFSLRYSPNQQYLFSGGRDAHLKVWALDKYPNSVADIPAHWYTINSIVFHPEKKWLATASRDKTIKIWNAETLELLKVLEMQRDGGHLNSVNSLLWHPYQQTLISASDDRSIILWQDTQSI